MGFWQDAFDNFGDNLRLVVTAAEDLSDNLRPGSGHFMTGDAPATAAEAERQNAAAQGRDYSQARADASATGGLAQVAQATTATGAQVVQVAERAAATAADAAGQVVDLATNKWVLGGVAALVLLVVAAPYLGPALSALTRKG